MNQIWHLAAQHGKQLSGSPHAVALVSIEAIPGARRSERITFVMRKEQTGQPVRTQLADGFLNQFGQQDVVHKQVVKQLSTHKNESTVVMHVNSKKSAITTAEWQQLQKYDTITKLKQELQAVVPTLSFEDAFRLQQGPDMISFMIRIKQCHADAWMTNSLLPCTLTPVGELAQQYRIIWEALPQTLSQLRAKYEALPGYRGAIVTTRGCGARFTLASHNQARTSAGLPPGEAFLIKGLPVELTFEQIQDLMGEMAWQATVLEDTRRTRGKTSTIRARAVQAPPSSIFRVAANSETYTLYITKVENREKMIPTKVEQPPRVGLKQRRGPLEGVSRLQLRHLQQRPR